jgi:hypothetical protein
LIGDRAYDSDGMDDQLALQGIKLLRRIARAAAAYHTGRARPVTIPPTLEGRTAVRLAAELQRIVVRYEHHIENSLGFV